MALTKKEQAACEAMSVDELLAWRVEQRDIQRDAKQRLDDTREIYRQKVNRERILDKVRAADLEGVVVVPETLNLVVDTTTPEAK